MSKLKRYVIGTLAGITTLALSGVGYINVASAAVGDLVKGSGPAVYVVYADGATIGAFPHANVYKSWGYPSDFSTVMTKDLSSYSVGAFVEFRDGTLVRALESPAVYLVVNKELRPIVSATVFLALGLDWDDILWLPQSFLDSYTVGSLIDSSASHFDGQLIKYAGSPAVYLLQNGQKRAFQSGSAFEANRYDWANVITVPDTETYPDGPLITGYEQALALPTGVGEVAPPSVGTGVTVAISPNNPASATVVKSAARVPFLKVNLTASSDGDVSVKLKVTRKGLSNDNNFSSVGFYDGLNRLGNLKTLNSSHQVQSDSITIPAGTTKEVVIAGNMASSLNAAEVASFELTEVISSASVFGSLPIMGNEMTMNNTISIGTLTVAEGTDVGSSTEEVGTTDFTFLNVKMTAATEDMSIEYIKFYNVGSAADSDMANAKLFVDSSEYASSKLDGKYVIFDLSSNPVTIKKGNNKTFSLHGDIVDGSARTFDFDVEKATDIVAKGGTYGFYVTPSAAVNGGNIITIAAGSLNISKSNAVPAGNVVENQNNVPLGAFTLQVKGEAVDISQMQFIVSVATTTGSSATSSDVTNVTLYDSDGNAVTSPQDPDSNNEVTFTDSITVPVGDNVYTVRGDLSSDFSLNDTITIKADLVAAANWSVTGAVTGETIAETPASTLVSANTQTIKTGSLVVTTASAPAAQSVVKGTSEWHFADIVLDASGSAEDIKVTQLKIIDVVSATGKTINISNIKLKRGGSFLSLTKNGQNTTAGADETFTYSLGSEAFTITKGTEDIVSVYADISASAVTSATHTFALATSTSAVVAEGIDTGQEVTEQNSATTGQAMTIAASGTLTTSLDLSNPISRLFSAGTTGNTLAIFKMEASVEDIELDELLLTETGASASTSASDITKLYLYDDAGLVASMTPTSSTPYFAVADGKFVVQKSLSSGKKLYVKADLADIGTGFTGTSGNQLGYKIATAGDVIATGVQSGTGATETGTATGNTHYMFKGVPVVTHTTMTNKLVNGQNDLYRFTVTASGNDVGLWKVTFYVATSGNTLTNFVLYEVDGGVETQVTNATSNMTTAIKDLQTVQFVFDNDLDGTNDGDERGIAEGQSKDYVLKATASGVSSGDSVSTTLNGDKSIVAVSTANYIWQETMNDNFIWSDRSVSSHATSTKDWNNGFKVSGLNVSSTPQTITN